MSKDDKKRTLFDILCTSKESIVYALFLTVLSFVIFHIIVIPLLLFFPDLWPVFAPVLIYTINLVYYFSMWLFSWSSIGSDVLLPFLVIFGFFFAIFMLFLWFKIHDWWLKSRIKN